MPFERSERALRPALAVASREQPAAIQPATSAMVRAPARPAPEPGGAGAMSIHVSKLRGISLDVRNKLKRQGISYTHQLLREAGSGEQRRRLAARGRIDDLALERLVRRADLARVKGIGAIFADMLEMVGVDRVATLAQQDPADLHGRLHELNAAERLARRAPTPDEVQQWITQARALPRLVDGA
jgi:predicted flap endonuclease-1-like 5' DNA nuclease